MSLNGLFACSDEISDIVGPSLSGLTIKILAFHGATGLRADGSSQATIRVELTDQAGSAKDGTVTLTTTLGALGTDSLAVINGVGLTTLTSVSSPGTASIVASIENVSATVTVPIVNF